MDPFTELNMENFINQRKEGAFTKLTLGNTLHNTPPRTASNAVMSGFFSAINEDLNTPSNQNYELQISFGYVIIFIFDFKNFFFTIQLTLF